MSKAISYVEAFIQVKGLLISQEYEDTQVKFALNRDKLPPFQKGSCIYIVVNEIEFEGASNQGLWNEEPHLSIFCCRKSGHVDCDAEFIDLLRWTQQVVKVLRGEAFHHRVIKIEVDGIAGFDTLQPAKEIFLHTSEIEYRFTIKGVTDV